MLHACWRDARAGWAAGSSHASAYLSTRCGSRAPAPACPADRASNAKDSRTSRNKQMLQVHGRLGRDLSRQKDDDRARRMEALKASDFAAYQQMLQEQSKVGARLPGAAGRSGPCRPGCLIAPAGCCWASLQAHPATCRRSWLQQMHYCILLLQASVASTA